MRSKRPNAAPKPLEARPDLVERGAERLRERGGADARCRRCRGPAAAAGRGAARRRLELERRALEAVELDLPRRRPGAAAGRGRRPGSGSRRDGRRRPRRTRTGGRSGRNGASPRRAGAPGAPPRVVEPVRDGVRAHVRRGRRPGGRRRSRSATCRRRARRRSRASARPRARAPRSGRAGRGRGFRAGARADGRGARPPAARPRPPRAVRARRPASEQRRGDARDEVGARAVPGEPPRGRRISATIAVVVVLPFVADTSATPAGSRAASASIAAGIELPEELSRQRRAAAGPGELREPRSRSRGQRFDGKARAHASPSLPRRQIPRSGDLRRPHPEGGRTSATAGVRSLRFPRARGRGAPGT